MEIDNINEKYGDVKISDRSKLSLTGVKKVVSFNPSEFIVDTKLGVVKINGNGLEIVKLDTSDGILNIKGYIDSLIYNNDIKNKESFITRLFK